MIVAQLRGIKFHEGDNPPFYWYPDDDLLTIPVLKEVAKWLGFNKIDNYFEALRCEERAIFKRAEKKY